MPTLELPPEIARRLDALSRRTGRSRDEHVRDALLRHLDAVEETLDETGEDVALAEARLDALAGGAETVPLSDLMKRHGVGG